VAEFRMGGLIDHALMLAHERAREAAFLGIPGFGDRASARSACACSYDPN